MRHLRKALYCTKIYTHHHQHSLQRPFPIHGALLSKNRILKSAIDTPVMEDHRTGMLGLSVGNGQIRSFSRSMLAGFFRDLSPDEPQGR
jgi:hypothetical protein